MQRNKTIYPCSDPHYQRHTCQLEKYKQSIVVLSFADSQRIARLTTNPFFPAFVSVLPVSESFNASYIFLRSENAFIEKKIAGK